MTFHIAVVTTRNFCAQLNNNILELSVLCAEKKVAQHLVWIICAEMAFNK